MNIKILKSEKNNMIVEFENKEATFGAAVKDELWITKGVDMAALDKRHPLVGKPQLTVQGSDAKKLMKEAAQNYKKKVEEFEKAILKEI